MSKHHLDTLSVGALIGAVESVSIPDLDLLSRMRSAISESRAAVEQSREAILLARDGIALLDRLQGHQISD